MIGTELSEFFVQEKKLADSKEEREKLWHDLYRLDPRLLPKFIDQELAAKILTIGKAINFLRRLCGDSEWIMGPMAKASGLGWADVVCGMPVGCQWCGGFSWLSMVSYLEGTRQQTSSCLICAVC